MEQATQLVKVVDLDTQDLDAETNTAIEAMGAIEVKAPDEYRWAAKSAKDIKAIGKKYDKVFDPLRDALHKSHKDVVAAKREKLQPIEEAIAGVKKKLNAYDAEQERIRREEQRKLEQEARELAEAEALKAAIEAEEEGNTEEAEAIIEAPVIPEPVVAPKSVPKAEGLSRRTTWEFQITNPHIVPREFLMIDEKKIRAHIKTHKGNSEQGGPMEISGVKVFSRATVAI